MGFQSSESIWWKNSNTAVPCLTAQSRDYNITLSFQARYLGLLHPVYHQKERDCSLLLRNTVFTDRCLGKVSTFECAENCFVMYYK